jgi:DNA-binding transcriptional regulator/RsmH inhibitor MraZ
MGKKEPWFENHKTMNVNRESLTIPKEFAEIINRCDPPRCFVTIGPKRLLIFPLQVWEKFSASLEKSKDLNHRKLLQVYRMYGYKTSSLDQSNRFKIAPSHIAYLQNPKEVVVAGQGNRLEVYRLEDHLARLRQLEESDFFTGPEGVIIDED